MTGSVSPVIGETPVRATALPTASPRGQPRPGLRWYRHGFREAFVTRHAPLCHTSFPQTFSPCASRSLSCTRCHVPSPDLPSLSLWRTPSRRRRAQKWPSESTSSAFSSGSFNNTTCGSHRQGQPCVVQPLLVPGSLCSFLSLSFARHHGQTPQAASHQGGSSLPGIFPAWRGLGSLGPSLSGFPDSRGLPRTLSYRTLLGSVRIFSLLLLAL